MIETLNVDDYQRKNIDSCVNFKVNLNVYKDTKRAIKLLEGSLVVKVKDKDSMDDEQTMYGER